MSLETTNPNDKKPRSEQNINIKAEADTPEDSLIKGQKAIMGSVIFDASVQTSQDSLKAVIWKQLPVADSTKYVSTGSSIDLWLKNERKDTINSIQQ